MLPLQYLIVRLERFDLFSVFVPVYVFLAIPVVSALADDPSASWSATPRSSGASWSASTASATRRRCCCWTCRFADRGAFLLFFLVMVVAMGQIAQEARQPPAAPHRRLRQIDRSFSLARLGIGGGFAAALGAAAVLDHAGRPQARSPWSMAARHLGELVMRALKKDAGVRFWGNRRSVTGAVGLLDRVAPVLRRAGVLPRRAVVLLT